MSPDTEATERLGESLKGFMAEFARHQGVPLLPGRNVTESHLRWLVDGQGKFAGHEAKFDTTKP